MKAYLMKRCGGDVNNERGRYMYRKKAFACIVRAFIQNEKQTYMENNVRVCKEEV